MGSRLRTCRLPRPCRRRLNVQSYPSSCGGVDATMVAKHPAALMLAAPDLHTAAVDLAEPTAQLGCRARGPTWRLPTTLPRPCGPSSGCTGSICSASLPFGATSLCPGAYQRSSPSFFDDCLRCLQLQAPESGACRLEARPSQRHAEMTSTAGGPWPDLDRSTVWRGVPRSSAPGMGAGSGWLIIPPVYTWSVAAVPQKSRPGGCGLLTPDSERQAVHGRGAMQLIAFCSDDAAAAVAAGVTPSGAQQSRRAVRFMPAARSSS